MKRLLRRFFRRAVEFGINFFDTADIYSLGVSEEITGERSSATLAWMRSCWLPKCFFR